jgi:hypothetical protein
MRKRVPRWVRRSDWYQDSIRRREPEWFIRAQIENRQLDRGLSFRGPVFLAVVVLAAFGFLLGVTALSALVQ